MREYTVSKIKHQVYDDPSSIPEEIKVLRDWRSANLGDWVRADDGSIVQIIRTGTMKQRKRILRYVGTCTGTFICSPKLKLDTEKRHNIYSFGGGASPEEIVENRRKLTPNEQLFVTYISQGIKPIDAYIKAFPTNNPSYARVKAYNLVKTKRVRQAMKEELKPICDELGIDENYILRGIKAEAETADKADTRLKALFKLSDIMDLEEKNTSKVQQVTGIQFQGFTDDMLEGANTRELPESDG